MVEMLADPNREWGCDVDLYDGMQAHAFHTSFIYPEGTDQIVTFRAGDVANEFGDWVEIDVDGNGALFSDYLEEYNCVISALVIESVSDDDKRYFIEVGQFDGDDMHRVFGQRWFGKCEYQQPVILNPAVVPKGSTVWYRMKSEQAQATCEVSFRWHNHITRTYEWEEPPE